MESMEEIYQNHSKKVYTFLLSKTCNHELAEELTQETFFCAVNSINKFKGNSSVLTWLCGIAQNLWLKYLRDNKSFEDLSNYEDMLTISSAEDELFIQWENVEILKSLHNLDEPMREVMYLRLIGEISFAQSRPVSELYSRITRQSFRRADKPTSGCPISVSNTA